MVYSCPSCRKVVAKEERRKHSHGSLVKVGDAQLVIRSGEAPKVRCSCGKCIILLKASVV